MKALVFQHASHESPGRFGDLIRKAGFETHTVNFWDGDTVPENADGFSLLLIMGGPMNVYESGKYPYLESEIGFTSGFIKSGGAVFGVCLGAQIMAVSLGAKVFAGKSKEIGWSSIETTDRAADDPVFNFFARRRKVFQWHGDGFEIPDGAVNLASSEHFPSQAFRYGSKAYGLQFHIETDEKMARDWLGKPENKRELAVAGVTTGEIERGFTVYGKETEKLADSVFSAFLKLV